MPPRMDSVTSTPEPTPTGGDAPCVWAPLRGSNSRFSIASFTGSRDEVQAVDCDRRMLLLFILSGSVELRLADGGRFCFTPGRGALFVSPDARQVEQAILGRQPTRFVALSVAIEDLREDFELGAADLRGELRAWAEDRQAEPFALEFALGEPHRLAVEAVTNRVFSGVALDRYVEAKVLELSCLSLGWLIAGGEPGAAAPLLRDRSSQALQRAAALLADGAPPDDSIVELARRVGVSHSKLGRDFRERFGMSPAQYGRRARLERAATLLRTSSLSILEVANEVGFQSQASFARAFREEFGHTPRGERKAASAEG